MELAPGLKISSALLLLVPSTYSLKYGVVPVMLAPVDAFALAEPLDPEDEAVALVDPVDAPVVDPLVDPPVVDPLPDVDVPVLAAPAPPPPKSPSFACAHAPSPSAAIPAAITMRVRAHIVRR